MTLIKALLRGALLFGMLAVGTAAHADLNDGYGVAVGKPLTWGLEAWTGQPGLNGKWPHYIITFDVNGTVYKAAVDMSTSNSTSQIRHREISLPNIGFPCSVCPSSNIFSLPDGWKALPYNDDAGAATGGALDFLRSPAILTMLENNPWKNTSDDENLIQYFPNNAAPHQYQVPLWDGYFNLGVKRIYVFGEPFTSGYGVHNIHQNQGDPAEGGHAYANGIYQDGAIVIEFNQQHVLQTRTGPYYWPNRMILMTRFAVQQDYTKDMANSSSSYYGWPGTPTVDQKNAQNAASGGWKWYGPYTAHQIEIDVSNTAGRPAIYVKYGSWPALDSYSAQADTRDGRAYLRLYNTSGQQIYVGVNACCGVPASWDYKATYLQ